MPAVEKSICSVERNAPTSLVSAIELGSVKKDSESGRIPALRARRYLSETTAETIESQRDIASDVRFGGS